MTTGGLIPAAFSRGTGGGGGPTTPTFTASAGLGTADATTGVLTLPGATVSTVWTDNPRLVAAGIITDLYNFRVEARIGATSGGGANTYLPVAVRNASGNVAFLLQTSGLGQVSLHGAAGLIAVGPAGFPLGGTGSLKMTMTNGELVAWTKTAGGLYVPFYNGRPAFPASPETYTSFTLSLFQGVGAAGSVSVTWADALYTA